MKKLQVRELKKKAYYQLKSENSKKLGEKVVGELADQVARVMTEPDEQKNDEQKCDVQKPDVLYSQEPDLQGIFGENSKKKT